MTSSLLRDVRLKGSFSSLYSSAPLLSPDFSSHPRPLQHPQLGKSIYTPPTTMVLLDLPPEMLQIVIQELVKKEGIVKAWPLRETCSTLPYITFASRQD
jgi:hypothetical protein